MDKLDTASRWSSKAEKYRWDYEPQAIQTIFDMTHISNKSSIADIGSGTGILTKHFLDKAKAVFAVEPNLQMRQLAVRDLYKYQSFYSIDGCSDATTLPDESVDLIIVGEALHWFIAESTKNEFLRILKPCGWLAVLYNRGTDSELNKAIQKLYTEKNGWNKVLAATRPPSKPMSFWYDSEDFLKLSFNQSCQETLEEFTGALSSNSSAPDEDNYLYTNFEILAKGIFDKHETEGLINVSFSTELFLGKMRRQR